MVLLLIPLGLLAGKLVLLSRGEGALRGAATTITDQVGSTTYSQGSKQL